MCPRRRGIRGGMARHETRSSNTHKDPVYIIEKRACQEFTIGQYAIKHVIQETSKRSCASNTISAHYKQGLKDTSWVLTITGTCKQCSGVKTMSKHTAWTQDQTTSVKYYDHTQHKWLRHQVHGTPNSTKTSACVKGLVNNSTRRLKHQEHGTQQARVSRKC